MTNKFRPWTDSDIFKLRSLIGTAPDHIIGAQIGRSKDAIATKRNRLGLPVVAKRPPSRTYDKAPSKELWIETVRTFAAERGISLTDALAGRRHRPYVLARMKAWRAILARPEGYSIMGVARRSGFDHTTILHSQKRLPSLEKWFAEVDAKKAIKLIPPVGGNEQPYYGREVY